MKQGQNIVNKICGVFSVLFAVVLLRGVIVRDAPARAQEHLMRHVFHRRGGDSGGVNYFRIGVVD